MKRLSLLLLLGLAGCGQPVTITIPPIVGPANAAPAPISDNRIFKGRYLVRCDEWYANDANGGFNTGGTNWMPWMEAGWLVADGGGNATQTTMMAGSSYPAGDPRNVHPGDTWLHTHLQNYTGPIEGGTATGQADTGLMVCNDSGSFCRIYSNQANVYVCDLRRSDVN